MKGVFVLALALGIVSIVLLSGCVQEETGTYTPPTADDIMDQVMPEEPEPAFSCGNASIKFDSCAVSEGIAFIGVFNNGIEDLNGFRLEVKYSDGTSETKLFADQPMDMRGIGTLQYYIPQGKEISSATITSLQCPELVTTGSECYQQ